MKNGTRPGNQNNTEAADFAAVQAKIDELLKPFKGWTWVYSNVEGGLATLDCITEVLKQQSFIFGGLSFLMIQVCDNCGELSIEQQEALMFAAKTLREEKEKINSIWPHHNCRLTLVELKED